LLVSPVAVVQNRERRTTTTRTMFKTRGLSFCRTPDPPEFLPLRVARREVHFLQDAPATTTTDADHLIIINEFGQADFAVTILTIDAERLVPPETTNFKFAHSFTHT
jgi:hypothetical protein